MTAGLPKRKSALIAILIILLGVLVGAAATLEQKRSSTQNHAQARTCSAYQKMTQSQMRHKQHVHSQSRMESKSMQGQTKGNGGNQSQGNGQQSGGRKNGS